MIYTEFTEKPAWDGKQVMFPETVRFIKGIGFLWISSHRHDSLLLVATCFLRKVHVG